VLGRVILSEDPGGSQAPLAELQIACAVLCMLSNLWLG
jgi:hypothetical protein